MKQQRIALHSGHFQVIVSHDFDVSGTAGRRSQCNHFGEDGRKRDGTAGKSSGTREDQQPLRCRRFAQEQGRIPKQQGTSCCAHVAHAIGGMIHAHPGRELEPHLKAMKSGAILANSGHFNDEINLSALDGMAESVRTVRPSLEEYRLRDGRKLFVLGEGRLVNLAAAEGHPAAVMDMSFANQALSAEHLVSHARELQPNVYPVPEEIDREIARLKLAAMHIAIDSLTAEQAQYLSGWESGTR